MDLSSSVIYLSIIIVSFVLSFYGATVGLILGQLRLVLLLLVAQVPAVATATNLAISGTGAFAGALRHARHRRVSVRLLLTIGIPSAIAAFFGARVVTQIAPDWATRFIGLILVFSGLNLAFSRHSPSPVSGGGFRGSTLIEVVSGVVLGALSSLVGLMLGSLRLPLMIRVLKVDPAHAVGTNMAIGFFTSALATIGALTSQGLVSSLDASNTGGIDPVMLLVAVPPTILGAHLGARMTGRFRKEQLKALIGWTVCVIGIVLIAMSLIP